MSGQQLREARKLKDWNQQQAAKKLGVSQTYLSLLESDQRRVPERLALKAVRIYGLSEACIPIRTTLERLSDASDDKITLELAELGYPGVSYIESRDKKRNPAELLLTALGKKNLDTRLVEALPWVVLKFPDLDWGWLGRVARINDLQNKLGFVVSTARKLAEIRGELDKAAILISVESSLERSRLLREETLCHDSLTNAEKRWLRKNRPPAARHWRLLTDLTPEQLDHAI
jgi:transcriptional regulator with XRE-family HTH domain